MAPLMLLCDRSPPALTVTSPRKHDGIWRGCFLREVKKARCSWVPGWRPCVTVRYEEVTSEVGVRSSRVGATRGDATRYGPSRVGA